MAPKIFWVLLPVALYALALLALAWRGRLPARPSLNVHTSLLLFAYLLATAGLGLFWVANQQLPVFDWHYLFGYTSLLLLTVHLCFNLPLVWRWLRGMAWPRPPLHGAPHARPAPRARKTALALTAALAAAAAAWLLGRPDAAMFASAPARPEAAATPAIQAVLRYHQLSSDSRSSVLRRGPVAVWQEEAAPFKPYPGRPLTALPPPSPPAARDPGALSGLSGLSAMLRGPAPRAGGPLRRQDWSNLLFLSAGITARRGGFALRAAPSSGALFPSELYLLLRRADGLAPGLYHYDPEHHRLHGLGPLPPDADLAPARDADALVVLASVFQRTARKYGDRAYRYATADAGHLLENLRLAAHAAGAHAELLARFDEPLLARLLGLPPAEEGVLAVAALRVGAAAMPSPPAPGAAPPQGLAARAGGVPPASVLAVHGATAQPAGPRAPAMHAAGESALPLFTLAPPAASSREVHALIAQRRSQRRFLSTPVALASLSALLADMAQPPLLSGAIRVNLVVNRVTGLEPGLYRYLPGHRLRQVVQGDLAAQAQAAALAQDVIGAAAVVLILSAERDEALAEGARGYRHLFLEAGLMGERWLLGAAARGLGACPVGAFYDDEAARLVKADAARHWVLHFAALGPAAAQ